MKHFVIKRQGVGWLAATALCVTALIVPGAAAAGSSRTQPAALPTILPTAEDQFEHPALCFKHDAGEDSEHGYYTEDGKAYVLYTSTRRGGATTGRPSSSRLAPPRPLTTPIS